MFFLVKLFEEYCIFMLLIQLIPEGSSRHEQAAFVTVLLQLVMDHLVAADVLLCGQSSSLPLTLSASNNYSILAANVFYFTTRVVDCVWNGKQIILFRVGNIFLCVL